MTTEKTASDDLLLWTTLYRLKTLPRTGWLDRGIPAVEAESVADHSYFTILLSWIVAQDDGSVDPDRVLKLALIHDAAESIAGDMPPYDSADIPTNPTEREAFFAVRKERSSENKARKDAIEGQAAVELIAMLPDAVKDTWQGLWHEYDSQSTPEARLVKEVDRLEAFVQSRLYARKYPDAPVGGFTDMAMQAITHPLLVKIRDAFLQEPD